MTSDSPSSPNAAEPVSPPSPTPIRVNSVYAPDLERTLKQVRSRWYPLQILLFVASAVFLVTTRMELWFGLAIMLTTATSTFLIWFQKRHFPWGNIEYFADRVAIEVNDRKQEILFEEIAELRYSLLKWYGG